MKLDDLAIRRLQRSIEIAEAVRRGEYQPPAFDSHASFFPPRPKIKKDKKAIAKLFGEPKGD